MKRRLVGHAAILAWLTVSNAGAGQASAPQDGPVRTERGLVSGSATASGRVFKGVPYAAPPVGPLRWRAPRPPEPWEGVREARDFGPPCAQAPLRGMTQISDMSREDCLTLNIWAPKDKPRGAGRPVMVWIHGGAFTNGSGSSATYDGVHFADEGVLLVTLNYRLGVFGFLAHPELSAESPHRASGNYGLEDQIAALRWVRANIAAFGGDPANVTLFGQSAGGASVLALMGSPRAKGLFARAIVQSGAARDAIAPARLADAEKRGRALAGPHAIDRLREMDTAAVLRLVQDAAPASARFGPVIDGDVIQRDPASALRRRSGPALPLLIGSNAREGLGAPDAAALPGAVASAFGANAARAMRAYGIADGGTGSPDPLLGTAAAQFSTDTTFRCGAVQIAQVSAARGARTWQYQFEQFVPGREALGAAHSFEVPYIFGTLSTTGYSAANYAAADRRLSALMTHYWANFAKTGDPNGAGLPKWPAYTSAGTHYVRFSSQLPGDVQAASDLRGDVCRLFPDSSGR